LRARGWETVRSPAPIADSFLPPDHCTAFKAERRRLKDGGVGWPDAHRRALLRLLALPPADERVPDSPLASDKEMWLL
jgi:hypothetical protein